MFRYRRLLALGLLLFSPVFARQDSTICGTTREKAKEQLFLHRQSELQRARFRMLSKGAGRQAALPAPAAGRDYGDVFVMYDGEGVVAHKNDFDLDPKTLTFTPSGANAYRIAADGPSQYDTTAVSGPRVDLFDDDFRLTKLPFPFPFFGATYTEVYINSDGNLTFKEGDFATSDRSFGRMVSGPPRIAGLFRDLDPSMSSAGVRTAVDAAGRFIVSWEAVPEYRDGGGGVPKTFQIRLSPDGRIDFSYKGVASNTEALVGIAPGRMQGTSTMLDLSTPTSQEFPSTVAERFGSENDLDTITASLKFFESHDDGYDYLVIFNSLDITAGPSAVAATQVIRTNRKGIGDGPYDLGRDWGSPSRLQAVINMGPLSQYLMDLNTGYVDGRRAQEDTPVTILAHEAGHLFLAYASVRDWQNPDARPMLGFQGGHWSFVFNSDASLLEGNRLEDYGPAASPNRFLSVAVTKHYSWLDQYLMGLRPPGDVPATFLATNTSIGANRHQQAGVWFDGGRRDVQVQEVIAAEGRRVPDHTVSQKRFRFAFIFVVPQGTEPAQADLDRLNAFRSSFETYFAKATDGLAVADTSFRRTVQMNTFPAAGVLQGATMTASVSIAKPAEADLRIALSAPGGVISVPEQVTIPAGSMTAKFQIGGSRVGAGELVATPADARYGTVHSHVQVSPSVAGLKLMPVSGDWQIANPLEMYPVVFKAVDANELPYQGVNVTASASSGGTLSQPSGVTGEDGTVSFSWTPGSTPDNVLKVAIEGADASSGARAVALGKPYTPAEGIVNAASFIPGITPGGLASIFGSNLAANAGLNAPSTGWQTKLGEVSVTVNDKAASLIFVSDQQINLLIPPDVPVGDARIVVSTPFGKSDPVTVPLAGLAPGIFVADSQTGVGAVLISGTPFLTTQQPAVPDQDFLEVYATGLGTVHPGTTGQNQETDATVTASLTSAAGVTLDAPVSFSGLAPGFVGLYQVNVKVPKGATSGLQTLSITVGGKKSNEVKVQIK